MLKLTIGSGVNLLQSEVLEYGRLTNNGRYVNQCKSRTLQTYCPLDSSPMMSLLVCHGNHYMNMFTLWIMYGSTSC